MTADVNGVETSSGRWSDAQFSFDPDARTCVGRDIRLRPGDLVGSGRSACGCLLEIRDETLGRYLEPGDVVTLGSAARGAADADRGAAEMTR